MSKTKSSEILFPTFEMAGQLRKHYVKKNPANVGYLMVFFDKDGFIGYNDNVDSAMQLSLICGLKVEDSKESDLTIQKVRFTKDDLFQIADKVTEAGKSMAVFGPVVRTKKGNLCNIIEHVPGDPTLSKET